MRIRFETFGLILGASLWALPVSAQEADAEPMTEAAEPEGTPESIEDNESLGAPAPAAAQAGVRGARNFEIRRGLFVRGDFGAFFAIGGNDVDRGTLAVEDNAVSNLQPMVGATVGYDLLTTEKINLSAGARFAYLFVAGSAQVDTDAVNAGTADPTSFPEDYEVAEAGLAVDLTYMLSERFGLLFHGDGGIGVVSPDPDLPATNAPPRENEDDGFVDGAGDPVIGGVFSGGAGVEYNTKLTGFSIGLTAAFYGVLTSESFIPGIGFYIPLKYNF